MFGAIASFLSAGQLLGETRVLCFQLLIELPSLICLNLLAFIVSFILNATLSRCKISSRPSGHESHNTALSSSRSGVAFAVPISRKDALTETSVASECGKIQCGK